MPEKNLEIDGTELTAIERVRPAQIARTPMDMLQIAVAQNCDLEKLTKLMELQERWERNEARKAFDKAFASFKSESVQIVKNIAVTDGPLKGKKYADLFAVVAATTPALSKHGLSSFWRLTKDDPNWMEVTCILRHELGHSESVSMGGAPDTGGAKNAIQARASTKSYLERYTFLAITGQAASGEDNDGNGANGKTGVSAGEVEEQCEWIANARDITELQKLFAAAYKKAAEAKDQAAMRAYMAAKDQRKRDLQ